MIIKKILIYKNSSLLLLYVFSFLQKLIQLVAAVHFSHCIMPSIIFFKKTECKTLKTEIKDEDDKITIDQIYIKREGEKYWNG